MNNIYRHTDQRREASGFTLLEIVFVLGMIGIIVAWVTLSVSTVDTEKKLLKAADGIESLIKRARSVAVLQQRPYQVIITKSSISMAPQYMKADVEEFEDDEEGAREVFENILVNESPDPEVRYEILRWRAKEWTEIEGDSKVVLTMDPLGMVEPVSIRCRVGKSWIMHALHPLTGGVRDEEMSVEEE
jgi:type II secretion system protein H